MYWRTEQQILDDIVETFRRVFRYKNSWINKDLSIVSTPSGSVPAFEQYFEENEQYPFIAAIGNGSNYIHTSFNNLIAIIDDDILHLGNRALTAATIRYTFPLASKLPTALIGQTLRGVSSSYAWDGLENGGDDILVKVYKNYTTAPEIMASGSLPGIIDRNYSNFYTELSVYPTITDEDIWVEFSSSLGSNYIMGIDTTIENNSKYYDSNDTLINVSGSVVSSILMPALIRMGGALEGSIILRCVAKNSTKISRNIASLIANYTELLKQAQFSRAEVSTDLLNNIFGTTTEIDEWLSKGIRIKGVRTGASVPRKRGDNDNIFSTDVVIDYYAEWFQDYPSSSIKEITQEIQSILPDFINPIINTYK